MMAHTSSAAVPRTFVISALFLLHLMNQVQESLFSGTFTLPAGDVARVWKGADEQKYKKWTFPVKITYRDKNATEPPTPPGIQIVDDMKIEKGTTQLLNYSTGYFKIYNLNPRMMIVRELHHAIYMDGWGYVHNDIWRNELIWAYQPSKLFYFKYRNISKVNSDVWFLAAGYDKKNYSAKGLFFCDILPQDGAQEIMVTVDVNDKELQIVRPRSPACRVNLEVNLKYEVTLD